MTSYNKPHLTYQQQIELLKNSGLIVKDEQFAIIKLQHISYYRLSAYFLPFQSTKDRFDEWNELKKELDNNKKIVIPKEREVYWASIGENIGFEQNGKSELFSRPVLVVKKFSKNIFFGIPLSTQTKQGSFFFEFELHGEKSNALLVQGRVFDIKRLEKRLGMIGKDDFAKLKIKLRELLDV